MTVISPWMFGYDHDCVVLVFVTVTPPARPITCSRRVFCPSRIRSGESPPPVNPYRTRVVSGFCPARGHGALHDPAGDIPQVLDLGARAGPGGDLGGHVLVGRVVLERLRSRGGPLAGRLPTESQDGVVE
ncbi:hypothetical protein [Agromyces sp. Soil535]|uniref:hypothetical protein n=1 Tax=Agromyces sp. Soil535 TaxID=1736390 RepID=UPI0012E38C87|nr:hypothetical protein [Agromyces sp. Soil535]